VSKVFKALQVSPDLRVYKVNKAIKAFKEQQVSPDHRESRVSKVQPVQQVQ
jgi:hypothetical protein